MLYASAQSIRGCGLIEAEKWSAKYGKQGSDIGEIYEQRLKTESKGQLKKYIQFLNQLLKYSDAIFTWAVYWPSPQKFYKQQTFLIYGSSVYCTTDLT